MVNKIILGTAQFGLNYGINNQNGKPTEKVVKAILDVAFENGIKILDTAEAYGDSQELIGNYHRSSSGKFKVITKFSPSRTDLAASFTERISQNLKVLDIPSLYGYMFHSFDQFETYSAGGFEEILSLKQSGLIEKFGVSIYTNEDFEKLLEFENIDFVQLPFNLLDNNFHRATLIAKAKAKGMEIHTRSAFLQGLFFKDTDSLPEKLKALKPYLDKIINLTRPAKIQINDLALNYVVQQKNIDRVLFGADTVEQLQKNLSGLQHKIPTNIINEIDLLRVAETELLNPSNWNK